MFANPEVQVAAGRTRRLKIPRACNSESCFRRRREIGGASDEPRQVRRDRVQNLRGRVTPCNSLRIGRKHGNVLRPAGRQLAFLNLIEFGGKLWEFLAVFAELLLPLLARFPAPPSYAGFEVFVDSAGGQKLGVDRPTVRLLCELDLFFAERLAMRGARILTVRRTVTDVALNDDNGRSARSGGSSL